jgi:hypothetical protein
MEGANSSGSERVELLVVPSTGYTNLRGRFRIVDLLIKVACFVRKVSNIFNVKRS